MHYLLTNKFLKTYLYLPFEFKFWSFGVWATLILPNYIKSISIGFSYYLVIVFIYANFNHCNLHLQKPHCEKSVRIWSYSGPHFVAFGLNTEKYSISPYSVRMRENTGQNNSEYGHFLRSTISRKLSKSTKIFSFYWRDHYLLRCSALCLKCLYLTCSFPNFQLRTFHT